MRESLKKINGIRGKFEGVFVRYGTKTSYKGYPQTTILLKDIKSVATGECVSDHLWFTMGKRFKRIKLEENDVVRFDARVTPYEKGYKGYRDIDDYKPIERDYRLSFPTNIVKVVENNEEGRLL